MIRAENSYRIESETGETSAWNMDEITSQMGYLYSRSRSKHNGKPVYKNRAFPGYRKQRGSGIWAEAFNKQDAVRMNWKRIEEQGELPHLYLECPFGEVRLNQDLAEFFLSTSEIANLYVSGWRFTAK